MLKGKNMESRALFQSIADDGSQLLFVILPDGNWAITRDKQPVADGTSRYASVYSGVKMFMSIIHYEPEAAVALLSV